MRAEKSVGKPALHQRRWYAVTEYRPALQPGFNGGADNVVIRILFSQAPAEVWQWVRSASDFGSCAPNPLPLRSINNVPHATWRRS